jgi:glycosyltransferase involved in cell wall biosynthesis
MVVLEALAAGARVIGSDAGGIREWATSYPDRIVLAPIDDIPAWTRAMRREIATVSTENFRADRKYNIRSISDVADEMVTIYERALNSPEFSQL